MSLDIDIDRKTLRTLKLYSLEKAQHISGKLNKRGYAALVGWPGDAKLILTAKLTNVLPDIVSEVAKLLSDKLVNDGYDIVTEHGNEVAHQDAHADDNDWRGLGQMVTYLYPNDKDHDHAAAEAVREGNAQDLC